MANYRIALGAIFTECNELGGMPIDLSWFERYELHRGDAILALNSGVALLNQPFQQCPRFGCQGDRWLGHRLHVLSHVAKIGPRAHQERV